MKNNLSATEKEIKPNTQPRHIVFTVVNDITTDQRMQRISESLVTAGYNVTLIGRELPHSKPLGNYPFSVYRMSLWFNTGKLFYIEYNLRLFYYLLRQSYDIYGAIDLDTILPHYLVSHIKCKPMTYDAHEYFAELPEIVNRPLVRWAWKTLERIIVPRLRHVYTINQTYADLFRQEYGINFAVVRNATVLRPLPELSTAPPVRYILYQGAVNVGRGVEEMIAAMPLIPDCMLYVCGKGDVYDQCVDKVKQMGLSDRVVFFGWVSPEQLRQYTQNAILGFTFFTQQGMSYYYSLANRFFDYIHSGVPQLCVDFPEYRHINQQYNIAVLLPDLQATTIAAAANKLLQNPDEYALLRQNCLIARQTLNWQTEEKTLLQVYRTIDN